MRCSILINVITVLYICHQVINVTDQKPTIVANTGLVFGEQQSSAKAAAVAFQASRLLRG